MIPFSGDSREQWRREVIAILKGRIYNRLRFPLEILQTVRKEWPMEKPLSVRISATDWAVGDVLFCLASG